MGVKSWKKERKKWINENKTAILKEFMEVSNWMQNSNRTTVDCIKKNYLQNEDSMVL